MCARLFMCVCTFARHCVRAQPHLLPRFSIECVCIKERVCVYVCIVVSACVRLRFIACGRSPIFSLDDLVRMCKRERESVCVRHFMCVCTFALRFVACGCSPIFFLDRLLRVCVAERERVCVCISLYMCNRERESVCASHHVCVYFCASLRAGVAPSSFSIIYCVYV